MADIEIVASAVGFDQVNKALDNTNKALDQTAKESKKAGDALNNQLKPGANQANQSLTNLSRIVQDAPFGFMGIANNINPLVESFGRLKQETGSTGGALKSLAGGLLGAGGLGLAVSAVTSLLVVFSGSMSSTSKNIDEVSQSTQDFIFNLDSAKTNLDSLLMSLDTASKIRAIDFKINNADKGAQSLFDASNNVQTLDEKMRATADHSIELIKLTSELEKEYDNLRINNEDLPYSIIAASKATSGLTEDAKALVDKWKNLKDEQKKTTADLEKYPELLKLARKEQTLANVESQRSTQKEKKKVETLDEYLAKFRESLKDQVNIGIAFDDTRLTERIRLFFGVIEGVISKFNQSPKSDLVVKLKSELNQLQIQEIISKYPSIVEKKIASVKPIDISGLFKLDINKIGQKIPPLKLPDSWFNRTKDDFNKAFAEFKTTAIVDAINTFAESIGQVITGELTFGDAFKAVFASLGDNIKQLGQQLIKIAILTQIAQKTLFTNPSAALAAGVGLVIAGTILKSLMTKKRAFATGTTFAPGGMALVGERGPELVNIPRGSQVIPAAQTASMIGGRNSVEVFGVLRGQDIYFSNKKYGQTYNRQA
jgi:hypothetical protein